MGARAGTGRESSAERARRAAIGLVGAAVVLIAVLAVVPGAGTAGAASMPSTGLYSSPQHSGSQITEVRDLVYGTAIGHDGRVVTLRLDLYLPPPGGPSARPTIVAVHGGAFVAGSRTDMRADARSYAERGYVAASISYRLDPRAANGGDALLHAASNAVDDGAEAIRWLRSKATTYRIDPTRIAMIGSSAGGAVALGVAVGHDPTPGGPLAAFSPAIAAAVSTGAHLTPALDAGITSFDATDAPTLLFHYDNDNVTGDSGAYARRTCDALVASGASCTFVRQAGTGHVTSLRAGGTWWRSTIGPFLWTTLRLGGGTTTTTAPTSTSAPSTTTTAPPSSATTAPSTTTTAPSTTTTAPSTTTTAPSTATGKSPAITNHPTSRTVRVGTWVSMASSATGTPRPTVRWQHSTDGGTVWSDIPGATSSLYNFTARAEQDGWLVRAVYSNSAGTTATASARLTVTP